jgi:hypothetical protein
MTAQYQEAVSEFTSQLRSLFDAPPGADRSITRSGLLGVPPDLLADRAEALGGASQQLGEMTVHYLDSTDKFEREAAEVKLLAQASADLEVAWALLEAADDEIEGQAGGLTRGGRSAAPQNVIDPLIGVLEAPLQEGIPTFLQEGPVRSEQAGGKTAQDLQDSVRRSLRTISRSAGKTSSLGIDTLLSLDPALLKQGAVLLGQEAGRLVEKVVQGFTDVVKKLVKLAVESLLRAYDWVLSLIGKDAEASARKKVQEWIAELRKSHAGQGEAEDLATQLVTTLFASEAVQKDVQAWLKSSAADPAVLATTCEGVLALGTRYEAKAKQVEAFFKAAKGANRVLLAISAKFPSAALGLPVIAAVVMALVGYTLFSGYDHVDSGTIHLFERYQVRFPDKVEGVRETVQKALGTPAPGVAGEGETQVQPV